ncbi:MAG: hypothetical protein AAF334_01125 [Pseudomonadota bacterium]
MEPAEKLALMAWTRTASARTPTTVEQGRTARWIRAVWTPVQTAFGSYCVSADMRRGGPLELVVFRDLRTGAQLVFSGTRSMARLGLLAAFARTIPT